MRRVLLTVHKFFPLHRAGTEVLTLKVAQELQRRGYEVLVVTANPPDVDARRRPGPATSQYEHEGVPVRVVEESLRLKDYTFKHEYEHPAVKNYFDGVIAEFKPDLLHIFHAQNLSASIIESAREKKIPVVCSATDFWFVCPVVQLKRPDGAICRGPEKGAANCLTCYTPQLFPPQAEFQEALGAKYPAVQKILSAIPGNLRRICDRLLFNFYKSSKTKAAVDATCARPEALRAKANAMDAIMVPTRLMREIFVENGIRENLIHHVPFGIDTEPLTPFEKKTKATSLRIGFIGTLFEHKGVDLLIEAFQALPENVEAVLKLYGDVNQFPDYGKKLLELAARDLPNASKIEFCGTFPNSELGATLANLDLLVVPSRWYENTPLVIQSALATRTPLIATNLGGLSELILHEQNGLLFELNNVNSLRDQLWRIVSEPGLLETFAANIKPERTVAQMVDDIETIYSSVAPPAVRGTIASLTAR